MDRPDPILVFGLPQVPVHDWDWRESLTYVLSNQWSSRSSFARTSEAENGLGITGQPHYFYAMRTEPAFGFAVFCYCESSDVHWPEDAKGATPFDSGGLWHNKITTEPPLDSSQRRYIFDKYECQLSSWNQTFRNYVADNYNCMIDYMNGNPPQQPTRPIIHGPPNSSRAWTWEVRVARDLLSSNVNLIHGFLSFEDHAKYLDWLWRESTVDDTESVSIQRWMDNNLTLTPVGELPFVIAQKWLTDRLSK